MENSTNNNKSRLQSRRDAMGNILNEMTDDSYARLHDIHDENQSEEEKTNCVTDSNTKPRPSSALSDRSVLRSPRFHQRRDAVQDGETVSRAMCSRLKQLQLMNNSVPGTVC